MRRSLRKRRSLKWSLQQRRLLADNRVLVEVRSEHLCWTEGGGARVGGSGPWRRFRAAYTGSLVWKEGSKT